MMHHRAEAVHMIYPHLDELECLVYSASGFNKGKEMLKSSFHLVWPQLIVDAGRAPVIRYVTLGRFKDESRKPGSELKQLQEDLIDLHETNEWELVFDSTTINARNGLRLPYNDKASMVVKDPADKEKIKQGLLSKNAAFKTRVFENRPSKAVGRLIFKWVKDEQGNDKMSSAEWVDDEMSYTKAEWIIKGSCRRDQSSSEATELTAWQLGPDVTQYLPKKPGEKYSRPEDGDSPGFETHTAYPNVRRVTDDPEPKKFAEEFDQKLEEEQALLEEEFEHEISARLFGSWIHVTDNKAVWRTAGKDQCRSKVPHYSWSRGDGVMLRPAEVVYSRKTGKAIIDATAELFEPLKRVLEACGTQPDDFAIKPVFDLYSMQD